jgi:hypothetical protein
LETRWQGMLVAVYKAKGGSIEEPGESSMMKSLLLDKKPAPVVVAKKTQRQTRHQREKARIRQLERRKSNRQKKRQPKAVEGPKDTFVKNDKATIREADNDEPIHSPLHHSQSDQPQSHEQLAARCRIVLENFISKQDLKFKNDNEVEEVLRIMYREAVCLGRPQKKMRRVVKRSNPSATGKISEEGIVI